MNRLMATGIVALALILAGSLGLGVGQPLAQDGAPLAVPKAPAMAAPPPPLTAPPAKTDAPVAPGDPALTPPAPLEAPAIAVGPAATPIAPAELEAFVDGLIGGYMRDDRINGAAIAVVRRDGPLLIKAYGADSADGRAATPERSLFRIASISKTFTWLSLLQMIEEGKVGLDAPVNTYLPAAARVPDAGYRQPVLVRHLFTHSAGFEDSQVAGRLFRADMRGALPLAQEVGLRPPARVRRPGEAAIYSNYGSSLAGLIVQEVGGQEFQARVESRIFGPLGMQRTTFREPYPADPRLPAPMSEALAKDVSKGFSWRGGRAVERPFEFVTSSAPAGGASTTAEDMARYMRMFLNQGELDSQRIISAETVAKLAGEPLFANAPGMNGLAYGFMQTRSRKGWRAYGHGGNTLWFASWMAIYPELDIGVFVVGNTEGSSGKLQVDVPRAIIDRFFPTAPDFAPIPKPDATAANALQRLAGDFLVDRRSFTTVEKSFCLAQCLITVTAAADGQLVISSGAQASRFAPHDVITEGARTYHRFRHVETGEMAAFIAEANEPLHYVGSAGISRATRIDWTQAPSTFYLILTLAMLAAAFALASGLWRALRRRREGSETRIVGALLPATGLVWLGAFGALLAWIIPLASDTWLVFSAWPPASLAPGHWLAVLASVLTAACIVLTALGWRRADWSFWRRGRLILTLAALTAAPWALWQWNLLWP